MARTATSSNEDLRRGSDVERAVGRALAKIGSGLYGVACSGGADSMALAAAAIRIAGAAHVVVLTIDHGLSSTSAAVCERVVVWARSQGAAAVVRRVEVARRASLEAAARDARYGALEQLADELGLVAILVGHTARDQAETVLMRLVRGTGPAGLAAIPARRGRFVRPLLLIDRDAIDAYVGKHALPTWDDPMNEDLAITRVRVRRELMPMLRRENPQLQAALVRLAGSAAEWLEVIDALARPFAQFPIACTRLAAQPAAIRKRATSLALDAIGIDCDAVHLDAIDRLVTNPSAGEVAIDIREARVVRRYDQLTCEPRSVAEARPGPLVEPSGGPYERRIWQPGDRMRPARLKGRSRKLSDLFGDAKIPRAIRAEARVLVRTTDHVIVFAEHIGVAHESVLLDGERESLALTPTRTGGSFWGESALQPRGKAPC